MHISDVEAIRIGVPDWEPQTGWTTSPLDALFDDGKSAPDRSMGVFNGLVGVQTDPSGSRLTMG